MWYFFNKIINRSVTESSAAILVVLFTFSLPKPGFTQISGVVVDSLSKEVLPNANVLLLGQKRGTVSDANGHFRFEKTTPGKDTLTVRYIGYHLFQQEIRLQAGNELTLRIALLLEAIKGPAVEVTSWRYDLPINSLKMEPGLRILQQERLNAVPFVLIPDVSRTLQMLPGVTAANDLSPQFYVRGGNYDQNLVMLDEAVVYFPFHIYGLLSSFSPDYIQDLLFSPGGFSTRYGNRLSSVVNIQTAVPSPDFVNRVNLHLLGMDFTLGHLFREKYGVILSVKMSHFDIYEKLAKETLPYSLTEFFGKFTWQASPTQHGQFLAFVSRDAEKMTDKNIEHLYGTDTTRLDYKKISHRRLEFGNDVFSLIWHSTFSDRLTSRFQGTLTRYQNSYLNHFTADFPSPIPEVFQASYAAAAQRLVAENLEDGSDIENRLEDLQIKASAYYLFNEKIDFSFGAEHNRFQTDYGWTRFKNPDTTWLSFFFDHAPEKGFKFNRNFSVSALFLESVLKLHPQFDFRPGIRVTNWSTGNLILEPRLNFQWHLTPQTSCKFAYGRFSQGVATMLERGLITFLPLYFPADPPEIADHFIFTARFAPTDQTFLSLTGYYKNYSNLLRTGAASFFQTVPGKAYGIETEGHTRWWRLELEGSYVWSHSRRRIDGFEIPTNQDIRHRFQILTQMNLGRGWQISAFWELHSGQIYNPNVIHALYRYYSPPIDGVENPFESYDAYEVEIQPGDIRYPYYHRLDVSLHKKISRKSFTFAPYLSIRNVYNRQNVLYYESLYYYTTAPIDLRSDQVGSTGFDRSPFSLPILPTFGFQLYF